MRGQLVLHVGAMKTGTSYIQSRLFENQALLARRGILVPGDTWLDQVHAVEDVLHDGGRRWDRLRSSIAEHPGTSVVSMEFLGPVRPLVAKRVVEEVDADVRVVITARDLNRALVSMWQETVQNGKAWTWAQFLAGVEEDRPWHRPTASPQTASGAHFWRQQNLMRIARGWSEVVGVDRVTVVTVPHPGADRAHLLWERFTSALGTSPDGFADAVTPNDSLGVASTLVVRRLNEMLGEQGRGFPWAGRIRKRVLAKTVLADRKSEEPALGLDVAPWVREEAAEMVERLDRLGVTLVGEWADLEPVQVPGIKVEDVPESEVAEAAIAGLAGLIAARLGEGVRPDPGP